MIHPPTTHRAVTAAQADELPNTSVIRHPAEDWPIVRQGTMWRRTVGDASTDVDLHMLTAEHRCGDFDVLYVPPDRLAIGDYATLSHLYSLPSGSILINEADHFARKIDSGRWLYHPYRADSYDGGRSQIEPMPLITPAELADGDLWRLAWLPGWRTESLR